MGWLLFYYFFIFIFLVPGFPAETKRIKKRKRERERGASGSCVGVSLYFMVFFHLLFCITHAIIKPDATANEAKRPGNLAR